ncbi:TPA: type VI secretion system tip protein VgrG [Escherichia coli]|uniref:RHS element core protein n=3 Tax=Escherichia coli TaxID=562 RepID=UPI000693661A|nr:RHS element core protein [Escherichia coli]EFM3169170.1 type VI secretion system tip protein VgrG [Escherichia coli]EFS3090671.1 type VI secretion system tip protein VgrG [Escherichia coli]EHL5838742.1 type VI secretion system tip protein VgrG [Escherichia coli]EIF9565357.1 type VI secretion system tip protein VgrG [Escherichia coli]EJJ9407192.1 type VI secretion system tip protein VgrG [Escherichia coli]
MSTGLRFTLEVDGLPPDAFAVVSFHLTQSLSSLFSLDLSLVSQQFLSLEFAQVLDKMAYLTVWQGDDVQRRVKGVVTWFELGENDKNQMLYSMKVCPPLWRTGLRQNFRIFQNEDIESILATILKENGVTEWSPLFSEPHPSREFCVQYGETDYDFLCRMAAEEGIFFYEEHAQKSTDQSLVLCDTVRYLPESFEIPWNPNTRTEVSTLCISQFRYSAQIRPSSVVTKDYTFKRPGWAGRFDQEGQYQDYQRTQYEVYDYPGRFKGAHGQNFARWQMDGWRNNAEVARGTSRSPEIWPGRRIALTGHPQANLNREWQVVASELHGEQPQAVPGRSGSGTTLNNHFAVIPADRTWRPQPLLKPLVDGPQSAVVTGPAGEEIFCDEHGRVRVKFNWDRYNPSNQDSSCWIRVAQAWAGTGFGNLAIPRVGQEVIVDFLNGDPDQPIIMGRTYHQENRTPGSLPGTKTQMTIRSKTYKGIRLSPHLYLATNSAQGPWWILGWSERVPGAEDVLPAPLPPYRELTGLADRFGRTLTYRREAAGDLTGEITGVTDGAGREFRLVLTTQAQRAEEARTSSLSSSDSSRPLSASAFPDTLPGTEYGPDRGIRLSAVWLMHDPAYPESLPAAPLVRYTYTEAGELLAVYDRSNTQVRAFTYDAQHPGRMVAHRYAGRPEMRYRYDDAGRVVEQLNPAGLSYRYQYEQDRITVTDSLNRREVLHTEGGAGLKRVVKKELADGSVTHSGYDAAGRLTAQTDAAGRRTEYGLNVVSGDITDITTPDGRETKFYYNDGNQLTAVVSPDGLESRREYDEPGRLVSETSRSGETVRYRYDDAHSELPATTTDATGSTRQMTWSRYGQLLAFTDCSGYQTRYEYDRFGQMTAVHREEGISLYRHYDNRGRLTSVKDAQGRETQYEYNAAGDLTAVITPDGNRSETQYDAWGKAVSTTQGGLTRSMEYDAAGRVISLTNENGSHSDFSYDALDRLVQQGGFDGRTQRYHYDLTGKLTQSEDEGLVILWYYDESDRITHRTVNGEPAEQWQYDGHGWLTDISHLSEGHRVAVHYGYDDKGRLTGECQTVENPETGELLWQHETKHAYNEQGLANRVTPDSLPPVEWLTYGSGYLAGMKLGGTPLVEYTRDRLHRETVRSFGSMAGSNAAYELTSTYTPAGQLQSQHLNSLVYDRDYGWSDNGDLVRISGPRQTREYGYSATGRLESVRTLAPDLDIRIPYATDPAGNRLPDPELHPDSTLTAWPDNRIAEDAHYVYHYDEYGRLTEKTDLIPAGVIRTDDERTHHYHYDSQHRLVFYTRIQHGEPLVESRYLYDPLGRRMAKRVWRRERDLTGWMSLSRKPEMTWYGWDGDRLTTVQTDTTRIQTVYQPGSFAPLIRIETDNGEREKAQRRSLAEKLQQEGSEDGHGVVFPAELVRLLDRLEEEIRADRVSSESRVWLAQCGLTVEQLARQVEPEYTPARKVHFYHCDHRGLPLALISEDGNTVWSAEYDEWGNQLNEENPYYLYQPYRLPGQQYDEESGLDYNRHRYYDPLQGRYITQDPIGLAGGWSLYAYPLNPVQHVDPLGLSTMIIGNGPVPDNPFGHAAAANRYGLMSSGTGDEMGASVSDYFKKMQPRRDTWIWIIDTTDEEEQCMMNKAIDLNKKLKTINLGPLPVANNCFSRTNMIFEACGFSNPSMNTNAPISLQVLGELYGYQRYFMPKGPFTGFPFEFQEVK